MIGVIIAMENLMKLTVYTMSKLINQPAEYTLVGSCLASPEILEKVIEKVGPQDFYDQRMGTIFSAIARATIKGNASQTSVVEELRSSSELDSIGGSKVITWLLGQAGTEENAIESAGVIKNLSSKRDQAAAALRVAETINEGGDPVLDLEAFNTSVEDDGGWVNLGSIINNIIEGTHKRLEPTILKRTDGSALLYPARLNLIAAPPESMKSWLAKLTCIQQMQEGHAVVYIDCEESDGITCSERLYSIAMGLDIPTETLKDWLEGFVNADGVRDPESRLFFYKAENTGLSGKSRAQILRLVRKRKVPFVVLDGFASAMASHNPPLEEDRARDVNLFLSGSVFPIVASGAGVLVVDHVAKSSGTAGQTSFQSRGPRGSGAKLAAVSGVALMANVLQAGSAWQEGKVEIFVTKDRPGRVKIAHRANKRLAGILVSNPILQGIVEATKIEIQSPDLADAIMAEKRWDLISASMISRILTGLHTPISKTEIKEMMNDDRKKSGKAGWRGETLVKAIDFLITNGYCKIEKNGKTEMIASLYEYKSEWGACHVDDKPEESFF
jgi:hypothetical protein